MTPLLRRLPLVLALAAPLASFAQGPQAYHPQLDHGFGPGLALGNGPGRGPESPVRRQMQAYVQANVLPVLRQQRQQLEAQLAPADQSALAGYRTQLHDLRTQSQALRERPRPADGTRPAFTDEQRQQAHALRSKEWEIMGQVHELARKYASNIQQLTQKIQPQRTQWTTDLRALLPPRPVAAEAAHPAHQSRSLRHGGPLGELLRPSALLLLEPAAPTEAAPLSGTSLYPNPAVASAQLQYEVKQAGAVRVELLDAQGNPLRTLVSETSRQPGTYSQTLDFSDLPQGTYFYKITTAASSQTKRFVKE